MWNLLIEIGCWLWSGITPSSRTQAYLADLGRNTYIYCPMIAVGFMLIGLHTGWVGGYVIAAIFSLIPVVLMELARRFAADVPVGGKIAGKWINTAATPHTWLAILNFWLIILQPSSDHIKEAYLAILAVALFIVVCGRWGKEPKWYRPLTLVSLFMPALIAVGTLAMDALWPEELVALKTSLGINRAQGPKNLHGQRYDQNIQRVVESGTGYRVVEHWYGDADGEDGIPVPVWLNEPLWRTESRHQQFPNGLYYAEFRRQTTDLTMTPDPENVIWYPESKVAAAGSLETRRTTLPVNTVFYPDNNGQPSSRKMYLHKPHAAEITGNITYYDGATLHFTRLYDGTQIYQVWVQI